jgi:hypothetical protein
MHPKIQRLIEIRLMTDEAQCPEFSALCEELTEEGGRDLLPDLFKVFTDQTEHHEVMADLQGAVENYPPKVYADALTDALPSMLGEARGWAKQLLRTMLQSPTHAKLVREARTRSSAADRKATASLFEEIAAKTPQVHDLALELAKL